MTEHTFLELGLPEALIAGLLARGIRRPAPIQAEAYGPIAEGRDVLAEAETGSGKTLAYLLPILAKLDWTETAPQALILTPTHELAVQVEKVARLLGEAAGLPLRTALLIGGASRQRQLDRLKEKPQLLVGSAGRVLELFQLRKLKMSGMHTIVLDEADRLLSLEAETVAAVIKTTLRDRQLLAFSASLNGKGREAARALMKPDPVEIRPPAPALPATIYQGYVVTGFREKTETLRKVLAAEAPERALVFLNNPENLMVVTEKLRHHGILATALFGQDKKEGRRLALAEFREGRAKVLLCTDLAARGLDFPGLSHVIQMDAPEDAVQYQHRVGRCGRQGEKGKAILLLTPGQVRWVRTYEKAFRVKLHPLELGYGRLTEAKDKPVTKTGAKSAAKVPAAEKPRQDRRKAPKSDKKIWLQGSQKPVRGKPWDGMKTKQNPKRTKK